MAAYAQRPGHDPMRQQAIGRAREMVQGVGRGQARATYGHGPDLPPRRQGTPLHPSSDPDPSQPLEARWHPVPPSPEPPHHHAPHPKSPPPKNAPPRLGPLPFGTPTALLAGLDGDTMLILALMVMLYKDGRAKGYDKKLLLALAYLLV